jgi:hypothetical protein
MDIQELLGREWEKMKNKICLRFTPARQSFQVISCIMAQRYIVGC